MCIEFVVTLSGQGFQREEIDAGRYCRSRFQGRFDFGLELPWQIGSVLTQELEHIVADKVLAGAVGDAENIGDAGGVELDGERIVRDDQVLYFIR